MGAQLFPAGQFATLTYRHLSLYIETFAILGYGILATKCPAEESHTYLKVTMY